MGRKREDTKCIQKFSSKISLEMPTRKNKEKGGQHYEGFFWGGRGGANACCCMYSLELLMMDGKTIRNM